MSIILKHIPTGNEYIFLGTGLGAIKNSLPSRVLNELFPMDKPDTYMMIAACDAQGRIIWLDGEQVIVTEVEGKSPAEILPELVTTSSQTIQDNLDENQEVEQDFNEDDFDDDDDWI